MPLAKRRVNNLVYPSEPEEHKANSTGDKKWGSWDLWVEISGSGEYMPRVG